MKQRDLTIARILLAVGAATILFAPYFITRYSWLDLTQTGQIGDTIGGITSPITNIIGAALVFYALKAQIESNELTRKQFEKQDDDELRRRNFFYLTEQVNIIRSEINEFSFIYHEANSNIPNSYKGAGAIEKLADILPNMITYSQAKSIDPFKYIPILQNLRLLLESIIWLLEAVDESSISDTDKKHLISIVSYQYSSKIKTAFESKIEKYRMQDFMFNMKHETSESVFTDRIFNILKQIDTKLGLE